jgi:hypothetical protein
MTDGPIWDEAELTGVVVANGRIYSVSEDVANKFHELHERLRSMERALAKAAVGNLAASLELLAREARRKAEEGAE